MSSIESRASAPREAGRGAALDRVTRTMTLALGVGTVVYSLLSFGGFIAQYGSFSPIWSWGVVLTTFVPPLAAAALSAVLPARALRALLGVAASGHLAALVLLVPSITTPTGTVAPELAAPWVLGISAIGTCAAAVAWRPLAAWLYLAACVVTLGVDRVLASSESLVEIAIQDALYTMLFDAIFAALAIATAHAGRVLDAAADRAIVETRAAAATEAAARERTRIEALVHDSVLVALLASARGAPRAAEEARLAVARLDDVAEAAATTRVATQAWIWRLQSLATDLAPAARFTHEWDGEVDSIPGDVAAAILEATAEAVRNSVQHAGPAARAVHVRATGHEVEVTVLDDGVGFDPSEVGAARLGVAVSILDRMSAFSDGRGTVVSQPGVGTRVALVWSRP